MPPQTGTILMPRDIGAEWGSEQAGGLARKLESHLQQPVVVCFPEDPNASFGTGIHTLVNAGCRRLVVLPCGLLPVPEHGRIPQSIAWAKQNWPFLSFHAAAPLSWLEWSDWLRLTALNAADETAILPAEAAVLLVGGGSTNPLTNANIPRLAHLLRESSSFAAVSHAFLDGVRPDISEALHTLAGEGRRNVLVVPWLIHQEAHLRNLSDEVQRTAQTHDLAATLTTPDLAHAALLNVLVAKHYVALSDEGLRLPRTAAANGQTAGDGRSTLTLPAGITAEDAFKLAELERRINALLPPEYQGRYTDVRPQSMGTAALKYDSTGKVAWDEIWTSFCDLALAGGPPHRGTLLEAVTAADALAEPEQYREVVAEIERAIRLVTSLPVVSSRTPGWVGIHCDDEDMAIWLMRAIIVENIMVRREGAILFLPAGPRFRLNHEIKNVVTAIAKTVHYWTAHLMARRSG